MKKINQKEEKRAMNELFAKRNERKKSDKNSRSRWINWCRIEGHPASCSCILPSRSEVVELSRSKR